MLCTAIDRADGFQLLSMLKLDPQTKRIPVVTYTSESDDQEEEVDDLATIEDDLPVTRPLTLH